MTKLMLHKNALHHMWVMQVAIAETMSTL